MARSLGVAPNRSGILRGNVQYGYRLSADRTAVEPDPEEQRVVKLVNLLHRRMSTREIAHFLNTRGFVSRTHKPFSQTQVVRMLRK